MRTAKALIRLGGCPGWSEPLLGAHSFCWFCHVAAHMLTQKDLRPRKWLLSPSILMLHHFVWNVKSDGMSSDVKTDISQNITKPTKWPVRPGKTQIRLGIRMWWLSVGPFRGCEQQRDSFVSVPAWFQADYGTNLIKQGEIVTGWPCGLVAQWSECLHGMREVLGSSHTWALCFFLLWDIWSWRKVACPHEERLDP